MATQAKIKHRAAAAALGSWFEYCDRRALARHHFGVMVARYENRQQSKGFNKWRSYATWMSALNSDAVKEAMEELKQTKERHKAQVMSNIVRRIKNRTAAIAMQSWVGVVGLQIGAPATIKSYEDFFSKKMRKEI